MLHLVNYIKLRFTAVLLGLLCCCCLSANAQYFDLDTTRKHVTIPFKLVRNLVVIQLKINNKGPFNFILDTGVGIMLITDPSLIDSVSVVSKRTIKISGFGEGNDFEAFATAPLNIDIPGLFSNDVPAAIFKTDHFNLSNYAGIPIHGLLGYEFFNRLAVKISFADSSINVSRPKDMRYFKKGAKIPLSIENHKPYFTTKVIYANGTEKEIKLVIDIGAGHYVSLENVADKNILQKKYITANLGMGIKGVISGSLSRISEIDLGKYKMKNVIAAFPDDDTRAFTVPRDGNLGIGLLKKFDIIFDYPNSMMYLKPWANTKKQDEHDMSGLDYYSTADDENHIIIYKVEPGSTGEEAGLEKDDEIISIDFKKVATMSLQQIDNLFKSQDGRSYAIVIFRDKKYYTIALTLKRRI